MPPARDGRALAVGDGALGFWKTMRKVFPATRGQRCWFPKRANVLPGRRSQQHLGAMAAMREIHNAEDIGRARVAIKAFEVDYGATYHQDGRRDCRRCQRALAVLYVPRRATGSIHPRTTNLIESTYPTVRLLTQVSMGPGFCVAEIATA